MKEKSEKDEVASDRQKIKSTSVLPNGLAVSETRLNYPCKRASAALIGVILFGIIFGECLLVDLNNEFEFGDLKYVFENVDFENYFIHGDFHNGPLCPTPATTPPPTICFNNNDNRLPGMDFVEYAFGVNDNENGFEYGIHYCRRKRRKRI